MPNIEDNPNEQSSLLRRSDPSEELIVDNQGSGLESPGAGGRSDTPGSAATTQNVQVTGLGSRAGSGSVSGRESQPTPVEGTENREMATVVDGSYSPLPDNGNGRVESEGNARKRNLLGDAQADIVELSSMITHPGLKKAESMEVLNLSLHQVSWSLNCCMYMITLTCLPVLIFAQLVSCCHGLKGHFKPSDAWHRYFGNISIRSIMTEN